MPERTDTRRVVRGCGGFKYEKRKTEDPGMELKRPRRRDYHSPHRRTAVHRRPVSAPKDTEATPSGLEAYLSACTSNSCRCPSTSRGQVQAHTSSMVVLAKGYRVVPQRLEGGTGFRHVHLKEHRGVFKATRSSEGDDSREAVVAKGRTLFVGNVDDQGAVSYTHLTLPTTPYV